MAYYTQTRNAELSTAKFIKDSLANDWSGVNLVISWSDLDKQDSPVVCLALEDLTYDRNELGSTTFRDTYIFNIDIFSTSEGQRLDLSHYILNILNPGWTYNTVTRGTGRNNIYTSAGRCRLDQIISNSRVDLGEKGDVKDKYHQSIIIAVTVGLA